MSKLSEMRALARAGMPIPTFEEIKPDIQLSQEDYGDYVVVKPSYELASWGQGIELKRRRDIKFVPPESFPEGHPGQNGPMIAQRFIDCGFPMTCRVMTLFGAPLFTYMRESTVELKLAPEQEAFNQADFMPSFPNIKIYSTKDEEILALAAAAYTAMPEVAFQNCDIIRDRKGRLHLLEVNPGGGNWMLSSPNASGYRRLLSVNDLAAEFDAYTTIARVLIERTRQEAE